MSLNPPITGVGSEYITNRGTLLATDKLYCHDATGKNTYEVLVSDLTDYLEAKGAAIEATATTVGFYGATPTVQLTGVAVTAGGIHAALVTLGLITA